MRDEDFERTMDAWADHELESAPELHPTTEMVRMVQARKQRRPLSLAFPRPAMAAAVAASLVLVAVLYVVLIRPAILPDQAPVQTVAYVGLREGPVGGRGVVVKEPVGPKGKGPKGDVLSFQRLWFQYQKQDSAYVESVDLQVLQEEPVPLSSADNYRLLLEPFEDGHVYVYQLTSAKALAKLFPNEVYLSAQNPLRRGETVLLPAQSNWFYLGDEPGQERLYVIASAQPVQEIENLFARYSQADESTEKQESLSDLLEALEAIVDGQREGAAGWLLILNHQ